MRKLVSELVITPWLLNFGYVKKGKLDYDFRTLSEEFGEIRFAYISTMMIKTLRKYEQPGH